MYNRYLLEESNFQKIGGAVGSRASLKEAERVAMLIDVAAAAVFTLKQHNAATGGTSKDLVLENLTVFYKKDADPKWSRKDFRFDDPATPASNEVDLTAELGGAASQVCIEVLGEDLDVDGGFTHVSVDGAASGFYVFRGLPNPAYRASV